MKLEDVKATAEVAADLGVKPADILRILSEYPIKQPAKFNGGFALTDDDSSLIVEYFKLESMGACPRCGDIIVHPKPVRKARKTKTAETAEGGAE